MMSNHNRTKNCAANFKVAISNSQKLVSDFWGLVADVKESASDVWEYLLDYEKYSQKDFVS